MDLLKLFTREEAIAGMEISDSYIRIALLGLKKEKQAKKEIIEIKALKKAPLKAGIIVNGVIENKAVFVKTLKEILKEIKPKIRYAVVSILPNNIYSHLYSFPKTVSGEKLEETMKLTIGFQLPMKTEEVYLDWEKVSLIKENEIFLASVPRPIIDVYTETLTAGGIMPVAVEFHPMSAVRLIDFPSDKTARLLLIADRQNINVSVIENRTIKFNRLVPADFLNDDIRKVIDF
ncbi:MAG: pilus assembly protein PilM [Candidatus Terrybacteria bacterium]|nr:pilus assembly protein PilM [Candidatus Terrybacteria bacterium]